MEFSLESVDEIVHNIKKTFDPEFRSCFIQRKDFLTEKKPIRQGTTKYNILDDIRMPSEDLVR